MVNAEFRILVESLGFFSKKSVVHYLRNFEGYRTLTERPVEYWLNGKRNKPSDIPQEVINVFLNLKKMQESILEMEIERINLGERRYKNIFKTEEYMWRVYNELYLLPVTFLNMILIKLNTDLSSIDYFENTMIPVT